MCSLRHHLFSPRAPITTCMTTSLIFQTFCNSIIKTWYLSIFSCSLVTLFRSSETAKSITWHSIVFVVQTMPGDLTSITLSVWILKSQRILYSSFLWIGYDLCACARACACVSVPFVTALKVMVLTQEQVHVGLNLFMAFSILTFNQSWTRTHNVCYILPFHYRVYIVKYRLSYKLSIWWD